MEVVYCRWRKHERGLTLYPVKPVRRTGRHKVIGMSELSAKNRLIKLLCVFCTSESYITGQSHNKLLHRKAQMKQASLPQGTYVLCKHIHTCKIHDKYSNPCVSLSLPLKRCFSDIGVPHYFKLIRKNITVCTKVSIH